MLSRLKVLLTSMFTVQAWRRMRCMIELQLSDEGFTAYNSDIMVIRRIIFSGIIMIVEEY